jgi:hypothetical protein
LSFSSTPKEENLIPCKRDFLHKIFFNPLFIAPDSLSLFKIFKPVIKKIQNETAFPRYNPAFAFLWFIQPKQRWHWPDQSPPLCGTGCLFH